MNHPIESSTARHVGITNDLSDVKLPVTVADIMTRDVVTVNSHQSFGEAIALIGIRCCHHLVVVDADGKLVGVVSDQDLFDAVAHTADWQNRQIGEVMTTNPVTVTPETPLFVVVSKIFSKRLNSFPVIGENETVTGILTSTDLLRAYQKMVELMQMQLLQIGLVEFSL